MKSRYFFILLAVILLPGLLPAPDLPSSDSFILLEKMRDEIIKKDQELYLQKYSLFKKTMAKYESNNNWKEYNRFGCIGKYQFGKSALNATGYGQISLQSFKLNPASFCEKNQESAMDILLKINESVMRRSISKYVGMIVLDSIRITRMGILAAAHLAGPANVKEFLDTWGEKNVRDRMGTHVSDYLKLFSRL